MQLSKPQKFIVSLLLCQGAGFLGSIFTTTSVNTWYLTIAKPAFTPPSWVFGPVWVTLYTLMAIAFFLIWSHMGFFRNLFTNHRPAILLFLSQLALNALWSVLFFGLQNPLAALIDLGLLLILLLATIRAFYKIRPTAAYLLIPYLLWASFAFFLNFSIWQLN